MFQIHVEDGQVNHVPGKVMFLRERWLQHTVKFRKLLRFERKVGWQLLRQDDSDFKPLCPGLGAWIDHSFFNVSRVLPVFHPEWTVCD